MPAHGWIEVRRLSPLKTLGIRPCEFREPPPACFGSRSPVAIRATALQLLPVRFTRPDLETPGRPAVGEAVPAVALAPSGVSGGAIRGRRSGTRSSTRWSSCGSARHPAGRAKSVGCGSPPCPARSPARPTNKKVYDRAGVVCPRGVKRTGDTAYIGTGLCTPPPTSEGPVDGPTEGREPAGVAAADRGGARDREDEGVADRGRAVSEPAPPTHPHHQERRRTPQPHVRPRHNTGAANRLAPTNNYCAATLFATRGQARAEIFEYLDVFHNRVRLHSSLGFLSPVEFERTYNRNQR